jgi:hypothetical protein
MVFAEGAADVGLHAESLCRRRKFDHDFHCAMEFPARASEVLGDGRDANRNALTGVRQRTPRHVNSGATRA